MMSRIYIDPINFKFDREIYCHDTEYYSCRSEILHKKLDFALNKLKELQSSSDDTFIKSAEKDISSAIRDISIALGVENGK